MKDPDSLDLANLRLNHVSEGRVVIPKKIQKRRKRFAQLPMTWHEILDGASGQTCRLAWWLLYMHWKGGGQPIKLANGIVPRQTKWKALRDLERRGLITIESRSRRSPIIRLTGPDI
jgi:hypothetical protein